MFNVKTAGRIGYVSVIKCPYKSYTNQGDDTMPRPRKYRKICDMPKYTQFAPVGEDISGEKTIELTVDEYEAIRLIDYEGLSQEECSEYMSVARTTVQQIYTSARKKIATTLTEGCALVIRGGSYRLCEGNEGFRACRNCRRRGFRQQIILQKEEKDENHNAY